MIEEYTFWSIAHYFVHVENYRIFYFSNEHNELWLNNPDNNDSPLIRLINCQLNWSNWLSRDIQMTGMNGENIRKHTFKNHLQIVNIYISPYLPVDDYEYIVKQNKQFDHTHIQTIILSRTTFIQSIIELEALVKKKIDFPPPLEDEITSDQVKAIMKETLHLSANREKLEKNFFTYGKPIFTYFFMVIQVIVFILLEINGGSNNSITLVKFGAKYNPLILKGEWWRFITPVFIHIGLLHLLMNSIGLYYLGSVVEKIYGSTRFLGIYLFSGLVGTIASFTFSPNLSAGASGAIYGCFGALLYIWLTNSKLFFRTFGRNLLSILALNIFISFTVPSIDLSGHLGGLIGGFIAAGIVHFPKKQKYKSQLLFLVLGAFLTISLLYFGFTNPFY